MNSTMLIFLPAYQEISGFHTDDMMTQIEEIFTE